VQEVTGFNSKRDAVADKLQEPLVEIEYTLSVAEPAQERNFCPRCGKRTKDITAIHTCTPPQEGK
jgi:hypothetical protein